MQVQTEAEERAALAYEVGWLAKATMDLTGCMPRVIEKLMEGDAFPGDRSASELACLCRAIRAEHPNLDLGTP